MQALLDTNILVYTFDQRDSYRQERATQVLRALSASLMGTLSVQCLAEFANVVTRRLHPPMTPGQALIEVSRFERAFPVHDLTAMIVLEALRGVQTYQLSYYDAQIWASARLHQIPLLLSEDFNQSILEGVRIVNPFTSDFDIEAWIRR